MAGYACGRGAAWCSFDAGSAAAAAGKSKAAAAGGKAGPGKGGGGEGGGGMADGYGLKGASAESSVVAGSVRVETFPKNRVGLHVVELALLPSGALAHLATRCPPPFPSLID